MRFIVQPQRTVLTRESAQPRRTASLTLLSRPAQSITTRFALLSRSIRQIFTAHTHRLFRQHPLLQRQLLSQSPLRERLLISSGARFQAQADTQYIRQAQRPALSSESRLSSQARQQLSQLRFLSQAHTTMLSRLTERSAQRMFTERLHQEYQLK